MKAIDKIAAQLQPQKIADSVYGAFTTSQLRSITGLAINTCAKACRDLEEEGRAFRVVIDSDTYWFAALAEAPSTEPPTATLPAPDFSTPSGDPDSTNPEDLVAAENILPRHIYMPGAIFYHDRSPKNRFITRCGMRIRDHWKSLDPRNTRLGHCAQCQRAGAVASAHKHQYATTGRRAGLCKCGARQK